MLKLLTFRPSTTFGARRVFRTYSSVADELKTRGPWFFNEPISTTHVEMLDASYDDVIPSFSSVRKHGQILPLGFHLIFFNPILSESKLSADGYHKNQAPDETRFPARMWLGGTLEFNHNSNQLVIGSEGSAMETINTAVYKSKEMGNSKVERLDVIIDRFLFGSKRSSSEMANDDWAIKETRSIGYFSAEASANRESTFTRHLKRRFYTSSLLISADIRSTN